MKTIKYFLIAVLALFVWSCSEDTMDDINRERNQATEVDAFAVLPDALVKTAVNTAATDLAWFASMYIEHSAGQWAQHHDFDQRLGMNAASSFNNHWNGTYDLLNIIKVIEEFTSPGGPEENNVHALGIAQILKAYNLAALTDFWGEVPWSEALQGADFMKPKFDRQSVIYNQHIFNYLDAGIANLEAAIAQGPTGPNAGPFDLIYNGDNQKWIKAAYSLKARYHMRLSQRDGDAASKALQAMNNGFSSAGDNFMFSKFAATATGENPWYQFRIQRSHLAVAQTLFDIMNDRSDPRMEIWFSRYQEIDGDDTLMVYRPAPPGEADRVQGGVYSESLITYDPEDVPGSRTTPAPIMTFHELKFIEAEALYRTGGNYSEALHQAIRESFLFHGLSADEADTYFEDQVEPLLAEDPFEEIMKQKYIAMYEHECMEAYHDYRRTGIPTMHNPHNITVGFPLRLAYGLSDLSSNPDNVPDIDVFVHKVWWAGGDELVP